MLARRYLPSLLQHISAASSDSKRQYLLLQSLAEVIASGGAAQGAGALDPQQQETLLALLLSSCEGEEECRNVAAECMGRCGHERRWLLAALDDERLQDFFYQYSL